MIYLELFAGFLKVGLFYIGGGYASIPLIRDVVMSYGWLSEDMLTYMIAVSESTPGPIMVNLATYVGITQAGMPGAFVATFAVVLPAFFYYHRDRGFFEPGHRESLCRGSHAGAQELCDGHYSGYRRAHGDPELYDQQSHGGERRACCRSGQCFPGGH